jgi:uncharacterized protein (TIGR02246 family)
MDRNPQDNHDLNAIKKLGEEYFEATNAGDAERCIATMAADVVIMPPNVASIIGTEQLRSLARDYHDKYSARYELVYDEVKTSGDLGFVRATVTGSRTSRSDGSVERVVWRNLWIVKRQADGQWKFWRIIFNGTMP